MGAGQQILTIAQIASEWDALWPLLERHGWTRTPSSCAADAPLVWRAPSKEGERVTHSKASAIPPLSLNLNLDPSESVGTIEAVDPADAEAGKVPVVLGGASATVGLCGDRPPVVTGLGGGDSDSLTVSVDEDGACSSNGTETSDDAENCADDERAMENGAGGSDAVAEVPVDGAAGVVVTEDSVAGDFDIGYDESSDDENETQASAEHAKGASPVSALPSLGSTASDASDTGSEVSEVPTEPLPSPPTPPKCWPEQPAAAPEDPTAVPTATDEVPTAAEELPTKVPELAAPVVAAAPDTGRCFETQDAVREYLTIEAEAQRRARAEKLAQRKQARAWRKQTRELGLVDPNSHHAPHHQRLALRTR